MSLSIDGDSQGVERLYEALSAHMWPGMSLKSGNKIIEPSLPEQEDGPVSTTGTWKPSPSYLDSKNLDCKGEVRSVGEEHWPSTSASQLQEELDRDETPEADESDHTSDPDEGKTYDFEDLEMLMSEIGNMCSSLRLMPDFHRRKTAAILAMKMAAMFGNSSGWEEGFD
ncbi:GTP binding [Forsythia ovata]|uniref:GTP binding n=1 Tax=Forsythia ovata TaxID=205694 RepID=A0ABD1S1Y2_9LAMI